MYHKLYVFIRYAGALEKCTLFTLHVINAIQFTVESV